MVFLRGNGSPRTFRIPVDTLQRALTSLGFLFCFALLAALFFLGLNFVRPSSGISVPDAPPPPLVAATPAPPTESPVDSSAAPKTGLWQKLSGSGSSEAGNDSELKKELQGVYQDMAKLQAQIDGRRDLPTGAGSTLLQFFGPRSVLAPDTATNIRVRNPHVTRSDKEIALSFELHNIDPEQKPERGYIIVLAKSTDVLAVYPTDAFSPTQNIVLDFTKGETFGIARFREARAIFTPAALSGGKKLNFQILLFASDGRVVANLNVEDKP